VSQLTVLKILLELTTLQEAKPGQLVNSVLACDLNLITGLWLLALDLVLGISKLVVKLNSEVAD
jgi:hypothetical protein